MKPAWSAYRERWGAAKLWVLDRGRQFGTVLSRETLRGIQFVRLFPSAAVELIYPPACTSCGIELEDDNRRAVRRFFCDECFESLEILHEPMCLRCAGPLPLLSQPAEHSAHHGSKADGCYRCRGRKLWFDETVTAGLYEGLIRELVLRMKQSTGDQLSIAMGRLLGELRHEHLMSLNVDVVAPIPLYWRRRLQHRTNSAAVIAEVLASQLRVPMADGLLRRTRSTTPQSELSPTQRWQNVRRAFSVPRSYHLRAAHVLLVDDILTTGATCSEAAKMLKKVGAKRVTVAVIARAIG